jgi:predicted Rossmann fold nucleotide-binding protein DprA/Smf involved in DNA uptake
LMDETQLSPETLAPLDDGERFDWLRLLRCENIGPRTFNVLLSRHGSAGAALAALPALIASGKPGRKIRIATSEETEREIEAAQRLGVRFIGIGEPDYPALLRRTASAPPLIAMRGNLSSLRRSKIAIVGARRLGGRARLHIAAYARNCPRRACDCLRPRARDRRAGASGGDRDRDDRGPRGRFGEYLSRRT